MNRKKTKTGIASRADRRILTGTIMSLPDRNAGRSPIMTRPVMTRPVFGRWRCSALGFITVLSLSARLVAGETNNAPLQIVQPTNGAIFTHLDEVPIVLKGLLPG